MSQKNPLLFRTKIRRLHTQTDCKISRRKHSNKGIDTRNINNAKRNWQIDLFLLVMHAAQKVTGRATCSTHEWNENYFLKAAIISSSSEVDILGKVAVYE